MARKTGSHAEITGPAVRNAALRLFARSGYAAVSMREIAAEVGVRAGALYLYTPDKQSLLFELMQSHMTDLLAAWGAIDADETPKNRLRTFIRFHLDYHLDRQDEVFLAYMELRNLTAQNFADIERLRRAYEAELEKILTAGKQSGDFNLVDVRVATMAVIAMITGVNTWYKDDGRLNRDRLFQIYLDMVAGMVVNER